MDIHRPYIKEMSKDETVVGFCNDLNSLFETWTIPEWTAHDNRTILFIDSLEHLTHERAERLVRHTIGAATRVLIFAPIGFHDNQISDGNHYQLHLSEWQPKDLEKFGFSVLPDLHFHCTNPPEKQAAMFARWDRP